MPHADDARQDAAALGSLLDPLLDPLFWAPKRQGLPSAWWAHVPFAFWITTACRPRRLVELGTHNGVSFAAFCEAVQRGRLATRCFAIDSWEGDEHAGLYDDAVYHSLCDFHAKHYTAFAELIRARFDDALPYFEDGSIDLLHIDGYHTYEAVSHDFATWRPKLSDRAVVLFHDTNVRRDKFGVYRFFREISQRHPSFEFSHGYGLGLLAVGAQAPAAARALCAIEHTPEASTLRERFALLGARWVAGETVSHLVAELTETRQALHAATDQETAVAADEETVAADTIGEPVTPHPGPESNETPDLLQQFRLHGEAQATAAQEATEAAADLAQTPTKTADHEMAAEALPEA